MKRFMYIAASVSLVLMFVFYILMGELNSNLFMTLGITAMTTCYHFTIRLVIGSIISRIKAKDFKPDSWRFRERKFERKLYKALRVKKWKKHVPTYEKRLFSMKENTLDGLVRETCRAETVHMLDIAASLASITFAFVFGSLPAFIITGVLGALVDLVFVVVQRYNRPRLKKCAEMGIGQ